VLETACGTGIVTRYLRETLPDDATLVATDLNEAMIDFARAAVPAAGITWQQADAEALPFDHGTFDVVVCAFGVMFLPDKVQGFREARRVLAPGGLLLANAWHSLEVIPAAGAIHRYVGELFPDDPRRFLETPYGYHDHERIRADLAGAGWENVQLDDIQIESQSPSAADFATGFAQGTPLVNQLTERGADAAEVSRDLVDRLRPIGGDKPFKATLAATVITAVR
jgi:SAM-dependent methyltransferase